MKKFAKIISLMFLLIFMISLLGSCHRRVCKGMRPHMNDVKRGIAH